MDFEEFKNESREDFLDKWFPSGIAGYRASYSLTHPWVIVEHVRLEIKWAWQRVFRGWDDRVVWSIDCHLAKNIPHWINSLKNDKCGIPVSIYEEGDFDENWSTSKESDERAKKKYDLILDQISEGFESYLEMDDFHPGSDGYKKLEAKFDLGFKLFHQYFNTLWD